MTFYSRGTAEMLRCENSSNTVSGRQQLRSKNAALKMRPARSRMSWCWKVFWFKTF